MDQLELTIGRLGNEQEELEEEERKWGKEGDMKEGEGEDMEEIEKTWEVEMVRQHDHYV